MIWGLIIAVVAGTASTAIAIAVLKGVQSKLAMVTMERDSLKADFAAANAATQSSESFRSLEKSRYESLVAQKKKEIDQLMEELDACKDPAVVRERLRSLFSGEAGSHSDSSVPLGTVPFGTSPLGAKHPGSGT